MPSKRITIRVPEKTAQRIKEAAGGKALSAWVAELIDQRLDDAELQRQWDDFYRTVNPGPDDIRRADEAFERLTRPARRKRVA